MKKVAKEYDDDNSAVDSYYESARDSTENTIESTKAACIRDYENALETPSKNYFIMLGHYYGYTYYVFDKASKIIDDIEDPVERFKRAQNAKETATDEISEDAAEIALREAYHGMNEEQQKEYNKYYTNAIYDDELLYKSPVAKNDERDTAETLDDVINDAETILDHGSQIKRESITEFSQSIYNIFVTVGTVVAVIVGAILGLKFMMSSVEGKAEVKKMLIAYAVGCIVVFASFGIWKIVITVLQNV